MPKKMCHKLKPRYEQTRGQSGEASVPEQGKRWAALPCPTNHFNTRTRAVSFTSLFLKQRRAVLFSGTRNLVCLSSFIEQMLKQNNISSQGFSIMYLSEDFVPLKLKNCQEVAQWVGDIAACLDKQQGGCILTHLELELVVLLRMRLKYFWT